MMRKMNEYVPPVMFHPGVILAEKLAELNMPIKEFAVRSQKPEKTIHEVLKLSSSITPDMAVQFENVLKIPARFWMKAQRDYDEYRARQRQQEALQQSIEWMKHFPVADMISKGILPEAKTPAQKTQVLLEYFGIAGHGAWEAYYQNQTLCTAFRLSLARMENQYSLSAWLRHGEIRVAESNVCGQYSPEKLKIKIPMMVTLANNPSNDFKERLVKLCAEVGIVLVYTPHIRNSRAHGATRWVNGCPLVQISDCRKKYDIFWFSFFHELGHILLHNKKDIFLEGIEYADKSPEKENQANSYANDLLVPPKAEVILRKMDYSDRAITELSLKTGIHAAFLVGRMHHLGILDHCIGNKFIPAVDFINHSD